MRSEHLDCWQSWQTGAGDRTLGVAEAGRAGCQLPATIPPPSPRSPYLGQQQDPLLKPPGQGLVRLTPLPFLQQLRADLADLLLELLPDLVQLPSAAQIRQKGRG